MATITNGPKGASGASRFVGKLARAGLAGLTLGAFALVPVLAQTTTQPKAGQPQRPAATPAAPAAPPSQKVPLKAAPDQPEWLKVCQPDPAVNKTLCFTTRDFVADNNQPVMAVAVFEIKEDKRRFVRFLVPLTFLIPPGVRFSVEGLQPLNARFQICMQQGCFVEGELNEAALNAMKKATTLRIDVQNQVAQEISFETPLAGFGKVFDGEGMTPEQLQKLQQEGAQPGAAAPPPANAEELRKRGEELLRQRQQTQPKQ